MAATAIDYRSTQSTLVNSARSGGRGDTLIEHQDHGKIRCYHFDFTAPAGGVAAAKVVSLGFLPQGLILPNSIFISTDFGSTGTIDLGFNEYKKNDGTVVAADDDELISALDVSGQAVYTTLGTDGVTGVKTQGFQLEGFAELIMTTNDQAMQAAARVDVYIFMVNGQ